MNRLDNNYVISEADLKGSYRRTKTASCQYRKMLGDRKLKNTREGIKELLKYNQILYEESFFRYLIESKDKKVYEVWTMDKLINQAYELNSKLYDLDRKNE